MTNSKKQHILALVMLCLTATVWGIGFLLSKGLLEAGFDEIPLTLNAIRFGVAAIILCAIFCRKIKWSKQLAIYGALGGLFLFGGFGFQIVGLKYTAPSSSGFFTAAYTLFVPFIAWALNKQKPTFTMLLGVFVALCGLVVLNVPNGTQSGSNDLLGNMLTLVGSLFFAAQIVLTDKALKCANLPSLDLSVAELCSCTVCFILSALIFESGKYSAINVEWAQCWWRFAIVSIFGTAFAYFAQTYGQTHMHPTEVSIIVACESPIGAAFSVAMGSEPFSWQMFVGGILVLSSVVLMEILPPILQKKVKKSASETVDDTTDPPPENKDS